MEATKVGVLVTALIVLVGLGMYFINDYTGALVTSGSYKCEETENLFTTSDNDMKAKQSIFKKGGTKTKVGSRLWNNVVPETCSDNALTERYCLSDGTATLKTVTCQNGCSNGKCNAPTIDCIDSDNGQDYLTEGTTTGHVFDIKFQDFVGVPPIMQIGFTVTGKDYCDTDEDILTEHYCNGVNMASTTFDCNSLDTTSVDYKCDFSNVRCIGVEKKCDGIDNNNDGDIDEGCDSDNDDYCNLDMTRTSPYLCSGSDNCCPLGGGDCDDGEDYTNPGVDEEDCIEDGDENCDGFADEDAGCSYTCVESGGYVLTLTASDGGSITYYGPYCSDNTLTYAYCTSQNPENSLDFGTESSACSIIDATCIDPDGPTSPEPADCEFPNFNEALPPIFKKYP